MRTERSALEGHWNEYSLLPLRDQFAAIVLDGCIRDAGTTGIENKRDALSTAMFCYMLADAMLEAWENQDDK